LKDAAALLDCSGSGRCGDNDAVKACARCVLSADSQHTADETDRSAARQLLLGVCTRLELPATYKVFGEGTNFEGSPLAAAMTREMTAHPAARLLIALSGDPKDWELDDLPVNSPLSRLGGRGRSVFIAVPGSALVSSDAITRRRTVLWSERIRASLIDFPPEAARVLCVVDGPARCSLDESFY
jgi:DEAD/DEAH box helicase domain-containing protein